MGLKPSWPFELIRLATTLELGLHEAEHRKGPHPILSSHPTEGRI